MQDENMASKLVDVSIILSEINQILQYPLSDEMVTNWSETILEANKDIDLNILRFVVFMFKLGEFEYDQRKGIINIFNGLKRTYTLEKTLTNLSVTEISLFSMKKIQRFIEDLSQSNIPTEFYEEKIKNYAAKTINNV